MIQKFQHWSIETAINAAGLPCSIAFIVKPLHFSSRKWATSPIEATKISIKLRFGPNWWRQSFIMSIYLF